MNCFFQEQADKHYEHQGLMQQQQADEESTTKSSEDKQPLRIMVPEVQEEKAAENSSSDYEYENTESESPELKTTISPNDSSSDFGSRIRTSG